MNERYDVLVIGAGAGGMAAACVAAAQGLKTLVLEKTEYVGGTTAISGGMVWAPNSMAGSDDSPEDAATYLAETVPTEAGADLRRAFLAKAPEAIAFLRDRTAVRLQPVPYYPDYYPEAAGATSHGRVLEPEPFDARQLGAAFAMLRPPLPEFTLFGSMMVARADLPHFRNVFRSARSAARVLRLTMAYLVQRLHYPRGTNLVLGNALVGRLLKSLLDFQVPIRLGIDVKRLERNDGRVAGVVVNDSGREVQIEARRGVILATGGFAHDHSRRADLYPPQAQEVSVITEGATGDGLRLGGEAGGCLDESAFGSGFWTPASTYTNAEGRKVVFPHTVTDRGKPGLIAVDSSGRRFVNEAVSYHEFVKAMLAGDGRPQAFLICDSRFIRKYGLGAIRPMTMDLRPYEAAGYLTRADSIPGLAHRLDIDSNALEATVAWHNRDAATGVDSEFGRGSNIYQRHFGDPEIKPNPCMAPIETPPFYSVTVYPADLGTATGLATDADARVLDGSGQPIPGLYACGNDMNSIMQGAYPGPGITIGPALVFGYLAAMHAAGSNRPDTVQTVKKRENR